MNQKNKFEMEVKKNIADLSADYDLQALSRIWTREASYYKWAYNFSWLGRPAIQFPNDTYAMQEIIWKIKPDLIIETGIAHGGSLIFSASMLALLDMSDAIESNNTINPKLSNRLVVGIDIDIRNHNKSAIESHPMASRIKMIEGSSTSHDVIEKVRNISKNYSKVLVCLDSNHTHEHVLNELNAYAPLVSDGSYCVVFDTLIEDMPARYFPDRPWCPGNSPKTAVFDFLKDRDDFEIDYDIQNKLLITVAPEGFLRRSVKNT